MAKFPIDAPKRQVLKALELLGFKVVREGNHVSMIRHNPDGSTTPLTMPNHSTIKGSTLRRICTQVGIERTATSRKRWRPAGLFRWQTHSGGSRRRRRERQRKRPTGSAGVPPASCDGRLTSGGSRRRRRARQRKRPTGSTGGAGVPPAYCDGNARRASGRPTDAGGFMSQARDFASRPLCSRIPV